MDKNMSKRKLVIHIGDPKTGSTSIQDALALDLIKYCGESPLYNSRLAHNFLPRVIKLFIHGTDVEKAESRKRLDSFFREILTSTNLVSVISAELFSEVKPSDLKFALEHFLPLEDFELRVICYVRPHSEWIVATFGESLKIGNFQGNIEQFYESRLASERIFPYLKRFNSWRDAFGSSFILRPFQRSKLIGGSVVTDFSVTAFGSDGLSISDKVENSKSNTSLGLEDLVRLSFIHRELGERTWIFHHHFGWEFHRVVDVLTAKDRISCSKKTKITMHRDLAQKVRDRFYEDALEVDKVFFQGEEFLVESLNQNVEKSCVEMQMVSLEAHFSDSEIRTLQIMTNILTASFQKKSKTWINHFEDVRIETRDLLFNSEACASAKEKD